MFTKKKLKTAPLLCITAFLLTLLQCLPCDGYASPRLKKKLTVMCYMNGDNNLAPEVLHAVDMLESVGSSDEVDILALVDGAPGDNGGYGTGWQGTRLLHITHDDEVGVINSRVIENLGEKNLGDPHVLQRFIRYCLNYPAEKYIFIVFAHGRGIIDTQSLSQPLSGKTLMLSPDDTEGRSMSHREFAQAVKDGMGENRFYLMLFFSCLTNMVEVGYELKDVTRYIIGSEDEIRIVNEPPGSFQIRGIEPELLVKLMVAEGNISAVEVGKKTIDSFINQYLQDNGSQPATVEGNQWKYPATLALVDCQQYDELASSLEHLAQLLLAKLDDASNGRSLLASLHHTLAKAQKYPSFLNLEYYDLYDFLKKLEEHTNDRQLATLCRDIQAKVADELILYERHTSESNSNGVSVFFPSFLIPDNIFRSHMSMYRKSRFSRNTSWALLIDQFRQKMVVEYAEILLDEYEVAWSNQDVEALHRLNGKIPWVLGREIAKGKYQAVARYLRLLSVLDRPLLSIQPLSHIQKALLNTAADGGQNGQLLESVQLLLADIGSAKPGV